MQGIKISCIYPSPHFSNTETESKKIDENCFALWMMTQVYVFRKLWIYPLALTIFSSRPWCHCNDSIFVTKKYKLEAVKCKESRNIFHTNEKNWWRRRWYIGNADSPILETLWQIFINQSQLYYLNIRYKSSRYICQGFSWPPLSALSLPWYLKPKTSVGTLLPSSYQELYNST